VATDLAAAPGPPSAQRLFEAVRDLLAEKPATDLTVREIAARAGVQHTLIRRHFGSRRTLLTLVVAETLSQFATAVEAAPDLAGAVEVGLEQFGTNQALTSGMAVLVVGHDITTFASYPLADAYEAQLVRAGVAPDRARDTATVVIALMAGWAIGQPFWLGMAGRRDDPRTVRDTIERAVWAVIDHATPVTTTINRERSTR
jgi:AcrR family transcriptional regulator